MLRCPLCCFRMCVLRGTVAAVILLGLSPVAARAELFVFQISVDGLRGDLLQSLISSSPGAYSNFSRLTTEGASTFNARTDFTHTNTLPNHASMLTGRPVSQPAGQPNTVQHGYTNNGTPGPTDTLHNSGNPNVSYVASTFDVAHDNGLSTALYASKSKFSIFEQSYNAANGAADVTGADNGTDKIDTYFQASTGSPSNASNMQAAFLADMQTDPYNYSFLHYRDLDSAGHAAGWGSATWNNALQDVDGYLGELFSLIENDPLLNGNTSIVLTADHGGTGTNHGDATDPADYTIPFMVWGPSVVAGADLYALNSNSRLDPGGSRPDYTALLQPIRNGDAGNLALGLLGLGPVPGSTINAAQSLAVPEPSPFVLTALGLLAFVVYRRWSVQSPRTVTAVE